MLPMQRAQVRSLVGELRSHMLQLSPSGLTTEPTHYKAHTPQLDKPICCNEDPEPPKQKFFFLITHFKDRSSPRDHTNEDHSARGSQRSSQWSSDISIYFNSLGWNGVEWSGIE